MIGAAVLGLATITALRYQGRRPRRLDGKVVLITGGSRGLGYELAKYCLWAGARVAICARDAAELAKAEAGLKRYGTLVSSHVADISDAAATPRLAAEVIARWGRIDVLVNNASVLVVGPMAAMTVHDYRHMMEVNVLGTVQVTDACLPELTKNHGGIITISSAAGVLPVPRMAPYSLSKAAQALYAKLLNTELGEQGLTAMVAYPGYMPTGFTEHTQYHGDAPHERSAIERLTKTPLISVKPKRAARLIVRAWLDGKDSVAFPMAVRLGILMQSHMPGFITRLMQRFAKRYY